MPEDQLSVFKASTYQAALTSTPDQSFEVVLRNWRQGSCDDAHLPARLKPKGPRPLPLGASATLVVERPAGDSATAGIPAAAITQNNGTPAVWVIRREGDEPTGTVQLVDVKVHAYRNDEVFVSGPSSGELVVTAGVQKMAPGLKVALPAAASDVASRQAAR